MGIFSLLLKFTSLPTSLFLLYFTILSCKTISTESSTSGEYELHKNYTCVASCVYDLGGPSPVDPHYKARGLSHGRPGQLTEAIIEMRGSCINYCSSPECEAKHGRECIGCKLVGACACILHEYWKWWPSGEQYGATVTTEPACSY